METIFFVALAIMAFGLISGRIENTFITSPMVFVCFGLLLGRWGFGVVPDNIETPLIHVLATVTLVLVLFTDASRIDLRLLQREHDLPVRLLTIGLPLTVGFGVVGAIMVPDALDHFHWTHLLYAIFSLTLIRMLPAAISLFGSGLSWVSVVFLGWFGPRGIASILYVLLLLEGSTESGVETILSVVMTTVLLSIFAHGMTAVAGSNWYAQHNRLADPEAVEHQPVEEMPVRIRFVKDIEVHS